MIRRTSHGIKKRLSGPRARPAGFIVLFVIIGTVALIVTRAATSSSVGFETENGVHSPALAKSGAATSGGQFVQFAAGATLGVKTIAAAGDIVWPGPNMARSSETATLVKNINPDAVLTLGDLSYTYNQDFQYDPTKSPPPNDAAKPMCGGWHYATSYYDHWGTIAGYDIKSRTFPAIGNHEYIYEPNSWDGPPPPDPKSPHPGYTCDRTSGKTSTDTAKPFWHYFGNQINNADPSQQAAGSDGNFNSRKGYYSYDLGSWHMIALNFECSITAKYNYVPGGCGSGNPATCLSGSPQWNWLCTDLKNSTKPCTLAYAHRPAWIAGVSGTPPPASATQLAADPYAQAAIDDPAESMTDYTQNNASNLSTVGASVSGNGLYNLVRLLQNAKADVLLVGHAHIYEHLKPILYNASNVPVLDPNGITEFIVGTGGSGLGKLTVDAAHGGDKVVAHSGTSQRDYGVLKMVLKNGSADYSFVGTSTSTVVDDSSINGAVICHAKP